MAIYDLKASGGDWSALNTMATDLVTMVNTGLTEDVEVRAENGGAFSGFLGLDFTDSKFNGHTLTIHSDIATPASPAIFTTTKPSFSDGGTISASDTGGIVLENIIFKQSGSFGGTFCAFQVDETAIKVGGRFIKIQNNLLYLTFTDSDDTGFNLLNVGGIATPGTFRFIENTVYISKTQFPVGSVGLSMPNASDAMFANNFIGFYNASSITVTTGKNTDNVVYAYDGLDAFTVNGTAVNLGRTNPNTVAQVIQANNETLATMAGRDARLTATSAALIGKANPLYTTTRDLVGTAR